MTVYNIVYHVKYNFHRIADKVISFW